MKFVESLRSKLEGLTQAVNRYPLTILFLVAIAIVNIILINGGSESNYRYLFALFIGALFSIVGEQIYERFFTNLNARFLLMGAAVLLFIVYYFVIGSHSIFNLEHSVKTAVIMFAGIMAFIWVPSIKSKVTFNQVFIASFKAFFTTVLFTIVIAGGIGLIIFATDSLLFNVDEKVFLHTLNLIYALFAPIFFLSFTPYYPGNRDDLHSSEELARRDHYLQSATSYPRMLEVLISYIIIPLTALYTIILLIYVLLNITGDFWTKNLMEPLLVSYAITVIIVYILASTVENKFAHFFRKIFPKVLIPIVLFQTIASILKINEMGVTHGRYYVILFGLFALIAALIFSLLSIRKNGLIVVVLIVFSAISIIPPIDAFTVSRNNQINLLESTLKENNMFENNEVIPNDGISKKDKKVISQTVRYLNSMEYTKQISWLPNNIWESNKFKQTFGFNEIYDPYSDVVNENYYAYLEMDENTLLDIQGFNYMATRYTTNNQLGKNEEKKKTFAVEDVTYTLTEKDMDGYVTIAIMDERGEELISFNTEKIFTQIFGEDLEAYEGQNSTLSVETATISEENDKARIRAIVNSADIYQDGFNADFNLFIAIK